MANTVYDAFAEFLSRLELTASHQDAVTTHHTAVRGLLESWNPEIKTHLIGSLRRRSRIRPRPDKDAFDIDILVILGEFVAWDPVLGVTPAAALARVERIVSNNATYDRMGPETDNPAIVIPYADGTKVELIPAYRDWIGVDPNGIPVPPGGRGYWIPKTGRWEIADYDYDADEVSRLNQKHGEHLIPMIKILKALKRNVFPFMRSYHLEVLALNLLPRVFQYCDFLYSEVRYPHALWLFFTMAKDGVRGTATIPGSKSRPACEYMAQDYKDALSNAFGDLASLTFDVLTRSDEDAIGVWRDMFGDPFPVYG